MIVSIHFGARGQVMIAFVCWDGEVPRLPPEINIFMPDFQNCRIALMTANEQQLKIRTAIVLLLGIVCCCVPWRSYRNAAPAASIRPAPVIVEVKGDVPVPGIYLLESGHAGVSDALRVSGRFDICPGENWRMKSGESLTVLGNESGPRFMTGPMPASARLAAGLKLDMNRASARDLLLIPMMRPEVADAITKRRDLKPWQNVGELVELAGVGRKTSERLESFLEVLPPGECEGPIPDAAIVPKDR